MSARPPRIEDVDSARRWRPLLEVDNRQRWLPLPPRLTPLPLSRAERFRPGTVGGVGVWGAQTRSVCRQDAGSLDYSCRVFRREVTKVVDLANGGRRSKAILGPDTFRSCPPVRSASPTTDDQPPVDPPAAPGRFALRLRASSLSLFQQAATAAQLDKTRSSLARSCAACKKGFLSEKEAAMRTPYFMFFPGGKDQQRAR